MADLISLSKIKSCDLDPVPASVLKQCLSQLLPVITSVVNISLESAIMPDVLKVTQIGPLLKKSDLSHEEFKHFRPVSNLAFISKVIEKAVAFQMIDYVDDNNLGEVLQSAYKKRYNTESLRLHALLKVQNDILRAIDQHRTVALVLLDLSSAFNTVDHEILLGRLNTRSWACACSCVDSFILARS